MRDIDRYKRALSVVRVGSRDINEEMVREGGIRLGLAAVSGCGAIPNAATILGFPLRQLIRSPLHFGLQIRGGFSEGYTSNSGTTVLRGTIKVRRGKLSVERLGLRP